VYAYTLFQWNGYYDFAYGKLYEKVFGWLLGEKGRMATVDVKKYAGVLGVENTYDESASLYSLLIKPLIGLSMQGSYGYEKFISTRNLKDYEEDNRSYRTQDMIRVQKENIRSNSKQADRIKKGITSDLKTEYIFEMNKKLGNKKAFTRSCAKTLKHASNWDNAFAGALKKFF
jgi:hypothetical protein